MTKNISELLRDFTGFNKIDHTVQAYHPVIPSRFEYTTPTYEIENQGDIGSNYIIISASGAIGKSALSAHLNISHNGFCWDLSKIRLGNGTFKGCLVDSVEDRFSAVKSMLGNGSALLVLDAFDEAEIHSGWAGIELFLKEVDKIVNGSNRKSCVLLARQDSAEYLSTLLEQITSKKPMLAKIGYFEKDKSASFVDSYLKSRLNPDRYRKIKQPASTVVEKTLEIRFNQNGEWENSFWGYAPVLQALGASIESENNPMALDFSHSGGNQEELICDILDGILEREKNKMHENLKIRIPEVASFVNDIYSRNDQIIRLVNFVLANELIEAPECVPDEHKATIKESIDGFLPQHPFLDGNDFSSPAFKDYIVAKLLIEPDLRDYAEMLLVNGNHLFTTIFSGVYKRLCDGKIYSTDIGRYYDAITSAHKKNEFSISVSISSENESSEVFSLDFDGNELDSIEFTVIDNGDVHFQTKLYNAKIQSERNVRIGVKGGDFLISDSELSVNSIEFNCDALRVTNSGKMPVRISAENAITAPGISVISSNKDLSVSWSGSNSYPWQKYDETINSAHDQSEPNAVSHAISRILGWFRKDKRADYARYKDLIDKHVVGKGRIPNLAFDFLNHIGSISIVGNLYYLDIQKIELYEIAYQKIRQGETSQRLLDAITEWLTSTPIKK